MEMRLRCGGLGGVDDFTTWENKLKKANTIEEFVSMNSGLILESLLANEIKVLWMA